MICPVQHCDRPAPGDATICRACQSDLRRALDAVPALSAELDVSLSKQTSRTSGGRSSVVPLPYGLRASEAAGALHGVLVGWVRVLGETETAPWPDDTPASMAAWLSARLSRLAGHEAAQEACEEITGAVADAERIVDLAPERRFAGRCSCGVALYAVPGAALVQCRDCDAGPVGVEKQRENMLARIEDQLAHAAAAGAILRHIGIRVPDSTIRYFAQERRILVHGKDVNRRPLYRIGDIIETISKPTKKAG